MRERSAHRPRHSPAPYNAGDAAALAEQFSKNADVIDGDGDRIQGREAIEQSLAATFEEEPGDKITLTIDSPASSVPTWPWKKGGTP